MQISCQTSSMQQHINMSEINQMHYMNHLYITSIDICISIQFTIFDHITFHFQIKLIHSLSFHVDPQARLTGLHGISHAIDNHVSYTCTYSTIS